jgi:hypothetical protein
MPLTRTASTGGPTRERTRSKREEEREQGLDGLRSLRVLLPLYHAIIDNAFSRS